MLYPSRTARLALRAWREEDQPAFAAMNGYERVTFSGGLEGQVEILWRLRHDAWGQGYATEAARACIAHAAKLGIPELVAFTFVGNGRSRRVMQKLGMTCVGEFDHPALPEGHPLRRHALYRIRTEQ